MKENYSFKIVCLDENNPIRYSILDEIILGSIDEVCTYFKDNYDKFDLEVCKWVVIPIYKPIN